MENFENLVKKGDEEYSLGNNELALSLYKKAVIEKPDSPEVWIKLGDSEIWAQPLGKDTGAEIEKSYEDYITAADLFEKTYYENGYKEILGGIMKQSIVLVGTILNCQTSKGAVYKIGEQIVACKILITWIAKFFTTKKFKFEAFQSEQFDFIVQIMDLIEVNIKDYYTRELNSDFLSHIEGIRFVYKEELLPILLNLKCCENKKKAIVDQSKKKVDSLKGELENLKIQKKILSEENDVEALQKQLKILEGQSKEFRFFKDINKKKKLKGNIDCLAHEIDVMEEKYQHELRHIAKKETLLNSQVEWLNDELKQKLSFFEK